jgi:hypothetical protein
MLCAGGPDRTWDGEAARRMADLASLAEAVVGGCVSPPAAPGISSTESLGRLQRATQALGSALTPDEVVRIIVSESVRALGAQQGTIVLTDEDRDLLRMRHVVGFSGDVADRWHEFPATAPVPLAVVAATGESMFVGTRAEMFERFPAVADEVEHSDRQSWAIAPVPGPDGSPLGALMVSWTSPHRRAPGERELLESFAGLCAPVLRRAEAYVHVAEVATALQTSLLPPALPAIESVELHARYVPAGLGEVGGDWYDALRLPGGRLGLIVGDVVGHGIWAAAQMGQIRHALRTLAFLDPDPARVLETFDRKVAQYGESVMATAFVGYVDLGSGRLEYAQAGHPPGMVKRAGGGVEVLEPARKPPLGVEGEPSERFGSSRAELGRGDVLLLYTDGLVERRTEPIDDGIERLRAAFASAPGDLATAAGLLEDRVPEAVRSDDFALLLVKRK